MLRMQYSGYDQNFRAEVLKSALQAYKNIKKKKTEREHNYCTDPKNGKERKEKNRREARKKTGLRKGTTKQ